jgi:hypothetical protein
MDAEQRAATEEARRFFLMQLFRQVQKKLKKMGKDMRTKPSIEDYEMIFRSNTLPRYNKI